MMIRNYDSGYIVVRHILSSSLKEIYICRNASEKNGAEYTIIRVKDLAMSQRLISFFTSEVDERKFSDFIECFTFQGRLNFVFAHSRDTLLMDKLQSEGCLFQERLEIAHKILERIVYLDLPYAFLADALMLDHIHVEKGLEIRFDYDFSYLDRLTDYTIKEAALNLDDVYRRIFSEELSKMTCPEIDEYLQWLENEEYDSYMDIFYRFNRCYAALKQKKPTDLAMPRTRAFRVWEKLRGFLNQLKRLLMAALLVGALCYLIYCILDYATPDGTRSQSVERFEYIGTVEIPDDMTSEEQTE